MTDSELILLDRKDAARFVGTSIAIASLAELLWARDSSAFAVTQSDGGWVGTWSVRVYRLERYGVSESNPGRVVLEDFKRRFPRCPDEYPNVAAVDWLDRSQRLGLVVEMPCHSSCVDMCKVHGYVVDPNTGTILERLPKSAIRSRWKIEPSSHRRGE